MSGSGVVSPVDRLVAGLDTLAAADIVALDDTTLRHELLELVTVGNRVHAELIRRVDVFDRRGLSGVDGFRSAKAWLLACCRISGAVAHRLVKAARLLRGLPKLAEVIQTGEVSGEHVQQVVRLADRVGADRVAEVEPTLADAAPVLDLSQFEMLTERVRAHGDPDGSDPAAGFERRNLTVSPVAGMVSLRGQLDPEGGAALTAALDALMVPPGEGDVRTAGQRRADALVELARRLLSLGEVPTVGGQRPQVGVLVYPQALSPELLATLADIQRDSFAAQRLRQFLADTDPGDTAPETDIDSASDENPSDEDPIASLNRPVNPLASARSTSSLAPACPTTPLPSAVTMIFRRVPVAFTLQVPSVTGDQDLRQVRSSQIGRHFLVLDPPSGQPLLHGRG